MADGLGTGEDGRGNPVSDDCQDADSRTSADEIRRKLLKAGAIGIPVAVSLQSGTAWAISSCGARMTRPGATAVQLVLNNLDDQQLSLVTSLGIPEANIALIAAEASSPGGLFPEASPGMVESGEMLWLMLSDGTGSCWASYCVSSVGIGGVGITGINSAEACG